MSNNAIFVITALAAVILAAFFMWSQKNARKQDEWRRKKQHEIDLKRAKIAAEKKSKMSKD